MRKNRYSKMMKEEEREQQGDQNDHSSMVQETRETNHNLNNNEQKLQKLKPKQKQKDVANSEAVSLSTTTTTTSSTRSSRKKNFSIFKVVNIIKVIQEWIVQSQQWIQTLAKQFGWQLLGLIFFVYFTQGIRATLTSLGTSYYLKETLSLTPSQAESLRGTAGLPWIIKPIYGIISDTIPIYGEHRRPYLIIFGTLAVISYIILSIPKFIHDYFGACFYLVLASIGIAICDVVIDAKVVEISRQENMKTAGSLQSLSWISLSLGSVLGSLVSGTILKFYGTNAVFLLSSLGPLMVIISAYYSIDLKNENSNNAENANKPNGTAQDTIHQLAKRLSSFSRIIYVQAITIFKVIRRPCILRPVIWIFLSNAICPSLSEAMFNFKTTRLGFDRQFLGMISFIGSITLLLSTICYNAWFRSSPFRALLFRIQFIAGIVALTELVLVSRLNVTLGINDHFFVLSDEVLNDVTTRLKHMPTLVLCAQICPIGVEGTLFALLMSLYNFSWTVSSFFGSYLCSALSVTSKNFDGLFLATIIRSIMKFVPLFLIFMIPEQVVQTNGEKQNYIPIEQKKKNSDSDIV